MPALQQVLQRSGVDVLASERAIVNWFGARAVASEHRANRSPFRSPADAADVRIRMHGAIEHALTRSPAFVRAGAPIDAYAVLLAEVEREDDARGGWTAILRRRLRGIEPPHDTWLLDHGASVSRIAANVLDARSERSGEVEALGPRERAAGVDVILRNDDVTPFVFVARMLVRELGVSLGVAEWIATAVHTQGEFAVARLPPAHARTMADRMRAEARAAGFPLEVTVADDQAE